MNETVYKFGSNPAEILEFQNPSLPLLLICSVIFYYLLLYLLLLLSINIYFFGGGWGIKKAGCVGGGTCLDVGSKFLNLLPKDLWIKNDVFKLVHICYLWGHKFALTTWHRPPSNISPPFHVTSEINFKFCVWFFLPTLDNSDSDKRLVCFSDQWQHAVLFNIIKIRVDGSNSARHKKHVAWH